MGRYRSSLDCACKVLRQEGITEFFIGLEPTLWRNGAWNGGYFGTIFAIREYYLKNLSSKKSQDFKSTFLTGAIGGIVGTILNTPFDVVKTRMQNRNFLHSDGKPPWALMAMRKVARNVGYLALYKGFGPKVLRLGPGGGILLLVYRAVLDILNSSKNSPR
jgi:solute carrier family 25 2-oxodicarboxylate transporter 21